MFEQTWHGIELASLPAAATARDAPASAEFYTQFYQALRAGRGRIDPEWRLNKGRLGEVIGRELLGLGRPDHGRVPRVLALAAGNAAAERVWLQQGGEVTFHDCQEASLAELRGEYPHARCLVGEIRDLEPEAKYDFITLLALDYVMPRDALAEFLHRISQWLTDGGRIILHCASVLSLRQVAAETVKRCLGHYRRTRHVFLGFWRTPGEFFPIARRAGLRLDQVFQLAGGPNGRLRLQPSTRRARWVPPLRDSNLIVTFTRAA